MKDILWKSLLDIALLIKTSKEAIQSIVVDLQGNLRINEFYDRTENIDPIAFVVVFQKTPLLSKQTNSSYTIVLVEKTIYLKTIQRGNLSNESLQLLQIYLPICFAFPLSKKRKRALVFAHFAQTLDGRIATEKGHSRWIGNEANLLHAHRMRAICDAVMIGANTLELDQPRLTVRMVEGKTPIRVVIGGGENDYRSLKSSSSDRIIAVGSSVEEKTRIAEVDYLTVPASNGRMDSQDILHQLFQLGIHAIYLEGGATTTSYFLKDKMVDVLQFHIAPMLFGSGRSSIILPEIDEVQDCIQFGDFDYFRLGDSIMFCGVPQYPI